MAVEMAFAYYESSLDPINFPSWMDNMDAAWHNYSMDDDEWIDSESSEDYCSDSCDY
jgi:hypothetical protein